jgi:TRAP-type C4-dicarboxylate transport system permease large subunit
MKSLRGGIESVSDFERRDERTAPMSHETIARAASTATYTGSTLSVGSAAAGTVIPPGVQDTILGLTLNQWTVAGIVFGMLMALAGLLVNAYFKRQYNRILLAKVNAGFPDGD